MPPAIGAAISAVAAAVFLKVGFAVAAKIFFASLFLGLLQSAFTREPRPGEFTAPRTITVRDPRAPRRLVLGRAWLGGTIVYVASTGNDHDLHLVTAFCDGPVDGFGAVRFDGHPVMPEDLDAAGNVVQGRYAGVARLKFHTGAAPQAADADLVAEVAEWTAAHRLDGIAYVYARLTRDDTAFPTGLPNISAEIWGAAWFDPRDSVTRWTPNAAVAQRGWLTDAAWGLGAGAADVDDTVAQASANTCDEMVPVAQAGDTFEARRAAGWASRATQNIPFGGPLDTAALRDSVTVTFTTTGALPAPLAPATTYRAAPQTDTAFTVRDQFGAAIVLLDTGSGVHTMHHSETRRKRDEAPTTVNTQDVVAFQPAADRLWRLTTDVDWRIGDRVTLATAGTLPPPLLAATDYYVVPAADGGFRLAASLADARARTPIALTGNGSGAHTVTRTAEPRYTVNGVISAETARGRVMASLMGASAGRPVWTGGVWRLGVGAAGASQASLDENDLLEGVRSATRVPRSERFNAIGGAMYDAATGQPVDYPELASAAFRAADNGERIHKPFDLPLTDSPSMAQRLAKIALLRARQEIGIEIVTGLAGLALVADEYFDLTLARFGWTAKLFEAQQWQLTTQQDGHGNPLIVVRLGGQEADPTSFDWDSSEEAAVDPAPDTGLPDPFDVPAPAGLGVTEELYETRDGAGVKARAILTWAAPDSGFVQRGGFYRVETREGKAAEWLPRGRAETERFVFDDIVPEWWEFRVQAATRLGGASGWSDTFQAELTGLLAPPADPANLQLQQISAMAVLTWDRSADLDVRIGGRVRVRWAQAETGATWQDSTEALPKPLPGDATQAVVPLRTGSYLVRFYDSSGVPSPGVAVVSTRAAEHISFTGLGTITESPTFPGTHSNTVVLDGVLKLAGAGLFDDIPDFDAVPSLDAFGGVASSGTYTFDAGFDFGSVKTVRITANLTVAGINTLDLIDSRTALIDSWEDFDGTSSADGDTQIELRETDDDPAGAPVWGPWRLLTAADRNARGMEFRAQLSVTDPAYNEHVSALSVTAQEPV